MPSVTAPDTGTGATVAFATTSFAAQILDIAAPNESRPDVDTTHLNSTARTSMPGDLVDPGTMTLEVAFNPDSAVPINQPAENITITWDLRSGDSTASSWQFTGYVTESSPAVPLEERMTATITIRVTGAIAKTLAT